jgi:hypothetical protein
MMMLKKLSACSRAELELEALFAGKLWAFTPVMGDYGWQLGIAVSNEAGYSPVPGFFCHADTYDEMADHADDLNRERGQEPREAASIVASSMAQGKLNRDPEPAGPGYTLDEDGEPICSDPGGHEWPRVEEHERCLCIHCGADGDA